MMEPLDNYRVKCMSMGFFMKVRRVLEQLACGRGG